MRLRVALVTVLVALAASGSAASPAHACSPKFPEQATLRGTCRPAMGVVIQGVPPRGCTGEFEVVVRAIGAPRVSRLVLRLDGRRIAVRRARDIRRASETVDCAALAPGKHELSASARTRSAHRTTRATFTVHPPEGASPKPAQASHRRAERRVSCRGMRQRGRGRPTRVPLPPKRSAPNPSIGGVDTGSDRT